MLIVIAAVVAMALLVTGAALVVFNFMGKDRFLPTRTPASIRPCMRICGAVQTDVSGIWEISFSIELMDKGKCKLSVDGKTSNGKWTLDEGSGSRSPAAALTAAVRSRTAMLTPENVMDMGLTLTFLRDGAQQPGTASNVPSVREIPISITFG